MAAELTEATVRVPCSTSNLGSGFDTLGLALNRYLTASFVPHQADGLTVRRSGTLHELEHNGEDLVADAFSRSLECAGIRPTGVLEVTSTIPVARGLGSSAAATLAGADLALAVQGLPRADENVFRAAYDLEGHGDNAAPCLWGGLRAVAQGPDGPHVMALDLSADVGFAYAAPSSGISTKAARSVLPDRVSHATAVRHLGLVISLVRGLATADPQLIGIGVKDDLHVPHRLAMIENGDSARRAGYDAGAWGVTVSGAGSGLIAICPTDRAPAIADAMRLAFSRSNGADAVGFAVRPDLEGLARL